MIREEEVKATPLCSRMCYSRENVFVDVWDVLRWMNGGRAVGENISHYHGILECSVES